MIIDKQTAQSILQSALSYTKADMAEAVIEQNRLALTRFAERRITDHIDQDETTLYIRCVKDKKIGVIATGNLSPDGIKKAVADCEAILAYMVPDEDFISLAKPDSTEITENRISEKTAEFGPEKRAEAIGKIFDIAKKGLCDSSGALRIEQTTLAVANSLGVSRYFTGNQAQISMTLAGKQNNSGWSMAYNHDASKIAIDKLALTALQKSMTSRDPASLADGQYTVILEPAAVGQLLILLSFMGFGCATFYQKRSFMAGKVGEKIAGDNFTVIEDPGDAHFASPLIDYEGTPKKRVALIENGIARGVVYNTYYANLMNTPSTGHALAPNNSYGPYPKNMVVAAGDSSIDEIIKGTDKGVLITHFWYLNFLSPMQTMVTGTTRDGTFLIENGEVSSPIRNMRTNQSILEAFSNIKAISKEQVVYPQYSVLMKVPAMKIDNFNLAAEAEDDSKC